MKNVAALRGGESAVSPPAPLPKNLARHQSWLLSGQARPLTEAETKVLYLYLRCVARTF